MNLPLHRTPPLNLQGKAGSVVVGQCLMIEKLLRLTHGCPEWYRTFHTFTPASSHISRATASSNDSPGSINPASAE
mgnify:CR=1 FL=1